jgi:ABC-2 type transport system ATP-binding protein
MIEGNTLTQAILIYREIPKNGTIMIWAENLTKYFDEFLAVDRVSLDVPRGHVLVLLGPNGAGKTTTVRMLTSILTPSSGRAIVNGFDVVQQPDRVRASVGVLTEQHGLYGRMNSLEYLQFFGQLYGLDTATTRRRSVDLLEKFGLSSALKKRLGEYSKGMRQKLALVRAMLHEPPVLLLDEPTSAMDPESARTVRDAIQLLKTAERTIILCTHNLIEAEELADQIAIIRLGRIIFSDRPAELKRRLLGPAEYEAIFAVPVGDWTPELPEGVRLTGRQPACLRFQVDAPLEANPRLLEGLISQGRKVVALQEVPRSLEAAYLEAVGRDG